MGKFCDFRPKSPFISETPVRDRPHGYYRISQTADRSISVSVTLSDLERQEPGAHFFARTVRPRTNKFGMIIYLETGRVSRVSATLPIQGLGP